MKKFGLLVVLAGLLLLSPGRAFADGSACANVTQYTNVQITVCYEVTHDASSFFLEVTSITGAPGARIFSIGWDELNATWASGPTNDWALDANNFDNKTGALQPQNIDGFDPNDWFYQATKSGSGGAVAGAIWTFNGDPGTDVVFHVAYDGALGDCSTWVASSPRTHPDSKTYGGGCGTNEVPEPATLTLLGTGLVGLAGIARKKLRRKV